MHAADILPVCRLVVQSFPAPHSYHHVHGDLCARLPDWIQLGAQLLCLRLQDSFKMLSMMWE
jgi:hypothetical protein